MKPERSSEQNETAGSPSDASCSFDAIAIQNTGEPPVRDRASIGQQVKQHRLPTLGSDWLNCIESF